MTQGYSSGGNSNGNTPFSSKTYTYDNFQGGFANFIQKEISSYMKGFTYDSKSGNTTVEKSARELNLDNVIAAFNNVADNIKNTYKNANNIKDNETTPTLEKLSAELNSIIPALKSTYKDNLAQFENQGTLSIADIISKNPEIATSLKDIKGVKVDDEHENKLDTKSNADLKSLEGSNIQKLLVYTKKQNERLESIDRTLAGIASAAGINIPNMLIDMNKEDDQEEKERHAEEEDWFKGLGSTISRTLFNHPGINKLGLVLGQLGNLALIKNFVSNREFAEKHPVLHKAAALAVYFQLPQLAVNLMGAVFQQAVSNWLVKSVGPAIGKGLTGIFSDFKTLGPKIGEMFKTLGPKIGEMLTSFGPKMAGIFNVLRTGLSNVLAGTGRMLVQLGARLLAAAGPIAIAAAIIAGVALTIRGIMNHRKNMAANDAAIDNSNMSQSEKDKAKLGAHFKSGVKETALPGALAGAGIGAAIGSIIPGVGTAIGAVVGGLIGLIAGPIISVLKPLGQMFQHAWPDIKANTANALKGTVAVLRAIFSPFINAFRGFMSICANAFKTIFSHSDKVISFVKPIMKFVGDLLVMLSPVTIVFRAIKTFIDAIKNKFADWFKDDNKDNPNIFGSNHPTLNKLSNAIINKREADDAKKVSKENGGFETVSMRNLGLHGKIDAENSIPHIAKKNTESLRQLDGILKDWGYDVKYTSAMGGKHATGPRSHSAGNKVDLVVYKNGKRTTLSQKEFDHLQALGYHGGSTGALGHEADHEDFSINSSNVKITEPYAKAFDEEKRLAKERAEEEKRKKEEEKSKIVESSDSTFSKLLNPIGNTLSNSGPRSDYDYSGSGEAIPSFTRDKVIIGGGL